MSVVFNSFPILGKKSNEIDEFTGELVGDELIIIANPTTGKLSRTTYASIKEYFLKNVSTVIKLDAGTPHYDTGDDAKITGFWFQGGDAADISIGSDEGLDDLVESGHLPEGGDLLFDTSLKFRTSQRIWFTGIQSDTVVIIYKS